ncbi:gamma carbonic anhydrase family protein [Alkalicella caledoniensis]|uniref:Gamma carbonic anhydrase family protein n=1 Tax=Alkalicella caledoniensis TaxID=2731377 RepID=A0A7G9WAM7_ALKCA|nr:gamma carbonic anhydrase family protein [Alkalicella caledoniensis]QNO15739.1 gamma carbonic anhydrase family protein [Alkalicella caledoniensis]
MIQSYMGVSPKIHENTFIHESAVIIGDVTIEEGVNIWPNVVIRGDMDKITIGKNTNIQDGSVLHVDTNTPLVIGEGVTVGHNAVLHGCTIEDFTLVGMGSTVLDGAVIKTGSIVGAGSLVPPSKTFDQGSLIVGLPGKAVRQTTDTEKEKIYKSVGIYLDMAKNHKNS